MIVGKDFQRLLDQKRDEVRDYFGDVYDILLKSDWVDDEFRLYYWRNSSGQLGQFEGSYRDWVVLFNAEDIRPGTAALTFLEDHPTYIKHALHMIAYKLALDASC